MDVGKSGTGTQSESPGLGGVVVVGRNRPQRGCLWQPYTRTQSKQGEARRSKLVNDKRSHFRWVRGRLIRRRAWFRHVFREVSLGSIMKLNLNRGYGKHATTGFLERPGTRKTGNRDS